MSLPILNSKLIVDKSTISLDKLYQLKRDTSGKNPEYSTYKKLVKLRPRLAYAKPAPPETIELYKEDDFFLTLPRGMVHHFDTWKDETVSHPVSFTPNFQLRAYQIEAVAKVVSERFGVLKAPTASGKTIMGLGIAVELQQRTIFLVHTQALLDQTAKEVKKMLGITPGIIGGGKFEIKDFTVAIIHSLNRRDPKDYADQFGLVIQDETHHVPAKTFSNVALQFNSRYMYGLSASIDRPDGLSWAIHALMGPLLHEIPKSQLLESKAIVVPKIIRVDTPYIPSQQFDPFDVANHINALVADDKRNEFIINYIKKQLKEDSKAVILTDRIEHIELLTESLSEFDPIVYHGKLSAKEATERLTLIKSSPNRPTIATYSSIGEGVDVPVWSSLFLTTPFASSIRMIQVIGRISRPSRDKDTATAYDFVDVQDEVLFSRYEKRMATYNSL